MRETFETLLPILTLALGTLLGSWGRTGDLRRTMRLEAADLLAELPALMWAKGGENDWVDLNTAVDRLVVRLNLAGIPRDLAYDVKHIALDFWRQVEPQERDGEVIRYVVGSAARDWDNYSRALGLCLGTSNPLFRRMLLRHALKHLGRSQAAT